MGAIARLLYLIKQNAPQEGLAFATPPWWDVERLFEVQREWQIRLPDGREVLLLDWPALLTFDLPSGKKMWNLPERNVAIPEREEQRAALLEAVQDAVWFIVARDHVWMAPEKSQPGCEIWNSPVWWSHEYHTIEEYTAWRATFWESHRIRERIFELPNPFWQDRVWLLTQSEAQEMNARKQKAYLQDREAFGRKVSPHHRREMTRLTRALQETVWVIIYEYEWESGLS